MGEAQNQPFQLSFNTALKIEFPAGGRTPDTAAVRAIVQRLTTLSVPAG